jgi:hypothetical protein
MQKTSTTRTHPFLVSDMASGNAVSFLQTKIYVSNKRIKEEEKKCWYNLQFLFFQETININDKNFFSTEAISRLV